jgi:DNA-binding NarL/FixJ family response regulator
MTAEDKPVTPLDSVLDTLELLVAQVRAYERALPPNNFPARAAISTLGELARQALNDARDLQSSMESAETPHHHLSPREMDVLSLASLGLTNKEIAYRLGISDRTVQFHMNSIFNKTGTNSRTEVVALAVRSGWLPPTS